MRLLHKVLKAGFCEEVINRGSNFFSKENIQTLRACMQCGTCVGGCPSGRRTAWRIREIFGKVLAGFEDEALKDENLWQCTTCYTCQERCPRKVMTTDIVRVLRNIAVEKGYMNKNHLRVCELLFKHGHAVPIDEKTKEVRKKLGLDETPPTVHKYPEALNEVILLVNETGFKLKVKRD
ncbi:MAG: CoB--CoM heterodisulfide reductase subunit C [Candidatus Bathyarchaeota archaeon]